MQQQYAMFIYSPPSKVNGTRQTYLHTGHRHVPRSQFSCRYDSRSKHWGVKKKKNIKEKKSNKMQVKQKCACNSSLTNNRLKSEKRKIEKKKIKKTQTHTFNREEKATVNEGRIKRHKITWMCRQSWPLAGSWIRRKVIGHFRDTLIAVCSTPSSPLGPGVPGMLPLLKFLLTEEGNLIFSINNLYKS